MGSRLDTLILTLFDPNLELVIPTRAEIVIYNYDSSKLPANWVAGQAPIVDPPPANTAPLGYGYDEGYTYDRIYQYDTQPPLPASQSSANWTPRLFAGYVAMADIKITAGSQRAIEVHAQDYTIRNKTTICNRYYGPDSLHPAGWSDAQIIQDIFRNYRPDIDVTNVQTMVPNMPTISFPTHTIDQMLTRVLFVSQGYFRVDYFKRLFYGPPGNVLSPLAISDSPGATGTSYLQQVVADGPPVSYYRLDDGVGTTSPKNLGTGPTAPNNSSVQGDILFNQPGGLKNDTDAAIRVFNTTDFGLVQDIAPNLLSAVNSSFETGVGTWIPTLNCSVVQTSAQSQDGGFALALKSTAGGRMDAAGSASGTSAVPITALQQYSISAGFRAAATGQTVFLYAYWFKANGTASSVRANDQSAAFADNTSGWTNAFMTVTAPSDAAYCQIVASVNSTAAAAEVHYVDSVSLRTGAANTAAYSNNFTFEFLATWGNPAGNTCYIGGTSAWQLQRANGVFKVFASGFTYTSSAVSFTDGNWDHLALVYSGATGTTSFSNGALTLYYDGVAILTQTGVALASTELEYPVLGGLRHQPTASLGTNAYQGRLDEWAMYSKALSSAVIQSHVSLMQNGPILPTYGAEALDFNPDGSNLINRVWVVGGITQGPSQTYTIAPLPNGVQWIFPLPDRLQNARALTITVNGVDQGTPGVLGIDGTLDNPSSFNFNVLTSQVPPVIAFKTPPPNGATVVLTGIFIYPLIQIVNDLAKQQATNGLIFEAVVRDKRIDSVSQAISVGQAHLALQGTAKSMGQMTFKQLGLGSSILQPGMTMPITNQTLFAGGVLPGGSTTLQSLITSVTTRLTDDIVQPYELTINFSDRTDLNDDDLLGQILGEQARLNAALDQTDVNALVLDARTITSERVGFQTEVLTTATYTPRAYVYDNANSKWGFGTYN